MGDLISSLFINPEHLVGSPFEQFCQVIFLIAVYGFILLQASKLISGGSELLLLTPFAGVIGSIVLPVLGAVPDGAIVLFSGMGPDAKQQIHVGVGALAGSTIMLLTIPWFLSNLGGRVDLDESGNGKYNQKPKLTSGHKCCGCMTTGSNPNPGVKAGGFLILITLVPYVVVQVGGFMNPKIGEGPPHDKIKWLVFSSLILCIALFVFYLVYQLKNQDDKVKQDKVEEVKMKAIQQGKISFSAAFSAEIKSIMQDSEHQKSEDKLKHAMRIFFARYDKDKSGTIDKHEMRHLLADMGERDMLKDDHFNQFMRQMDKNADGAIDFNEFHHAFEDTFKSSHGGKDYRKSDQTLKGFESASEPLLGNKQFHQQEDEEQEMPDDIARLPPEKQQSAIKKRAFLMMTFGTIIVLIFADPMVGALDKFGKLTGIGSFFVAFVLAPLASNASEILAAYEFAKKKTQKHITIAMSQLQGAACMNNTFCLGIFLVIIFAKEDLTWEYSAQTLGILIIEIIMVFVSLKRTQSLFLTFIVFLCFILAIFIVIFFERVIGWN